MSIVVSELSFAYGVRKIFDKFSCRFDDARMTALVGASGSGKSTLIALLIGQLAPASGLVSYPGSVLTGGRIDPQRIGWVMQTANVYPRRTVLDNVALPLRVVGQSRKSAQSHAQDAIDRVGLGGRGRTRCGLLSGGERQRVTVARALAMKAPLLIADEPTVSLDHENRDLLVDTIRQAADAGAIVIVATHDPSVYERCDAVVRL